MDQNCFYVLYSKYDELYSIRFAEPMVVLNILSAVETNGCRDSDEMLSISRRLILELTATDMRGTAVVDCWAESAACGVGGDAKKRTRVMMVSK